MSRATPPPPPAGWYPDADMADTQRYWDGQSWTDHVAPLHPSGATGPTKACGYCGATISADASRCSACGGEFRWCRRCGDDMPTVTKQKFVGMARGGTKTQWRCRGCSAVLEGPRW